MVEVVEMDLLSRGMKRKREKGLSGLGHGVQRGNLDYPVNGLIHNGGYAPFCASAGVLTFHPLLSQLKKETSISQTRLEPNPSFLVPPY